MRRLPREINHTPEVFGLKFKNFFLFGFLAAAERYLIDDHVAALLVILGSYLTFFLGERLIPKNLFFYLLTKVKHFENPYQ